MFQDRSEMLAITLLLDAAVLEAASDVSGLFCNADATSISMFAAPPPTHFLSSHSTRA